MLKFFFFFFFNDTATTEIYTLSLHDALPIFADGCYGVARYQPMMDKIMRLHAQTAMIENGFEILSRSEEHTSELQSRPHLVCRLLLEKKKKRVEIEVQAEKIGISILLIRDTV